MSLSAKAQAPPHVFADEVDQLVEFADTSPAEATLPANGQLATEQRPVLADVVDRLVEFTDPPANTHNPDAANARVPLLVDAVDQVLEFFDDPDQDGVLSRAATGLSAESGTGS